MTTLLAILLGLRTTALGELDLSKADQQWSSPRANRSVGDKPLTIAGRTYSSGVGSHARFSLSLDLGRSAERFTAKVGLDDEASQQGSVRFRVIGDGRELWASPVMRRGDEAMPVSIDLAGVRAVTLIVDDAGDGNANDHADWADAQFVMRKGAPRTVDVPPGRERAVNPGLRWMDDGGRQIQAHGGGILIVGKTYYWYGEEKSQGYNNRVGVACYSSKDLIRWKNEGVVLPVGAFPKEFTDQGVCERPKVLRNPKTGKYVMWMHLDANGYRVSEAGVAIADKPTGPFAFLSHFRPVASSTYRDMNLFQDDDGKAYAFYSGEGNATTHIVRLNDEYTAPELPMVEGKTWARALIGQWREAAAPFKCRGKYYLITSGCTGWDANEAGYAVADDILGPWTAVGNPTVGEGSSNTFGGQSTFVFHPLGAKPNEFVFMADRWNSQNLADSRYLWLPFSVSPAGRIAIAWQDSWKPAYR